MNTSLLELFQLGGQKNYEFHYKMTEDGQNVLTIDNENKIISVSIGDPENKELNKNIENIKKQLQ